MGQVTVLVPVTLFMKATPATPLTSGVLLLSVVAVVLMRRLLLGLLVLVAHLVAVLVAVEPDSTQVAQALLPHKATKVEIPSLGQAHTR